MAGADKGTELLIDVEWGAGTSGSSVVGLRRRGVGAWGSVRWRAKSRGRRGLVRAH